MTGTLSATPAAPARYSAFVRAMHWLGFLAVLASYVLVNLRGLAERGSPLRSELMQWHMLTGLVVLLLLLPRLIGRLASATPPVLPPPARWAELVAKLTHLALYAFLLVQPLIGVLLVQYGGHDVVLPGLDLALPRFVAENHDLKEALEETHEVIGTVFYFVIGAHILAALWHHFLLRDNTLQRMR